MLFIILYNATIPTTVTTAHHSNSSHYDSDIKYISVIFSYFYNSNITIFLSACIFAVKC